MVRSAGIDARIDGRIVGRRIVEIRALPKLIIHRVRAVDAGIRTDADAAIRIGANPGVRVEVGAADAAGADTRARRCVVADAGIARPVDRTGPAGAVERAGTTADRAGADSRPGPAASDTTRPAAANTRARAGTGAVPAPAPPPAACAKAAAGAKAKLSTTAAVMRFCFICDPLLSVSDRDNSDSTKGSHMRFPGLLAAGAALQNIV